MMQLASRKRKLRCGYTLIEVLAVLSIMLLVAVSAVRMLDAVTDLGINTKQNAQARRDVERLATQFRGDVSGGGEIMLTDRRFSILRPDGQMVSYEIREDLDVVVRTEFDSRKARKATESYAIAVHCAAKFTESPEQLVLQLSDREGMPWIVEAMK